MANDAIYPADISCHAKTNRYLVTGILFASVSYQAILCLVHTHLVAASPALVGLAELCIYLACIPLLLKRFPVGALLVVVAIGVNLILMSLLRADVDFKAFRDLLIPVVFYWLGKNVGDNTGATRLADGVLAQIVLLVLAVAIFELLLPDLFTQVFNIFSYYVSQGGITIDTNFITDSRLQLNGLRPEGIGRTILPALFGNHRISSIFLEPVSLGNFAVIVAAWGLAKPRAEIRKMLFFVLSAAVLITLSDSRYGLLMLGLLLLARLCCAERALPVGVVFPFLSLLLLIVLGYVHGDVIGDNVIGRLATSGKSLLNFDTSMILGAAGSNINFGDMGYAYVLTRFGLFLSLFLWAALWSVPLPDGRGIRFRAYIALYVSLILCVSGTSLFALKTAGIAWFLLGTLSAPAVGRQKSASSMHGFHKQYARA